MYKKVTVTGSINETFIGTEKEVFEYLVKVKSLQMLHVSDEDIKFYKKDAPIVKYAHDYHNKIKSYNKPSYQREKFREKYKQFGLKITIEPHTPKFF